MTRWICAAVNAGIRLGYRWTYRVLRLWWLVRRPHTYGAAVALWYEGKVLMVRTSYRPTFSLPGGFVRRGEPPEQAARRELLEEIRLDLPAEALRHAWHGTVHYESRLDTIDIWEVSLEERPDLRIDGREIIWAGWMDPTAAMGRRLLPHIAAYLAQRGEGTAIDPRKTLADPDFDS
jgi:ADP-ribose pyrophosphatase YjhB (NUDIX family)